MSGFLPAAAQADAQTSRAELAHTIHRTTHFRIEHPFSEAWAATLGAHLEHLVRQFPAEAAPLGVAWSPSPDELLIWRFATVPPADDGLHPPMLRASYSASRHDVSLVWAPGDQRATGSVSAEYAPDGAGISLDHSPALMLRISHELAHQLSFDSGLQKRGVMYPVWLAEGLAANFESPDEDLRYLGPNRDRARRLSWLARRGDLLPLSDLAAVTNAHAWSRHQRTDLYAQAWGFYRFLAETRNEELKAYLRHLTTLAPGSRSADELRREFATAFGPIPGVERAWRAWAARTSESTAEG